MKHFPLLGLSCALILAGSVESASQPQQLQPVNNPILQLVERIDHAEPINLDWVKSVFTAGLECGGDEERTDCDGTDIAFGDVTIGKVDFRQTELGSLLILEDFKGQCASVSDLRARFPWRSVVNSCSHGPACMYAHTRRSWGRFSVRLPDSPDLNCAKSVIFDTIER